MTHYLIKSHFTDWHEVSPARFEEYKANWMAHAQAIPADQKEAYFMAHHGQIVEMEEPTAEAKAQAMDAYEKGRISGMDLAGLLSGEVQAKAQAERQARDVEVYTLRAKSWPWGYAPTHRVQVDFWDCGVETSEPCYSEAEALEIYMRELERHGNEAQISLWVYTSTGLEPISYKPHMPAEASTTEASTTEEEPEELAEYYIARPEYADAIYWDQEPAPIHRDEVARLAREWGLTLEELLAQVEPIAAT